jgi:hypothetical protein
VQASAEGAGDVESAMRRGDSRQGIDPTTAEVWRVMWLELTFGKAEGETTIDVCARVAASLGARAEGSLRERLHGPVRPLDGSEIAANRPTARAERSER